MLYRAKAAYLGELRLLSRSDAVLFDMMPVGTTRLLSLLKSINRCSLLLQGFTVPVGGFTVGVAGVQVYKDVIKSCKIQKFKSFVQDIIFFQKKYFAMKVEYLVVGALVDRCQRALGDRCQQRQILQ